MTWIECLVHWEIYRYYINGSLFFSNDHLVYFVLSYLGHFLEIHEEIIIEGNYFSGPQSIQ